MEPPSVPPPPPPVSPFDPRPPQAPAQGRSGCGKPLVIGCVVLFVLAAIAAIGGFYFLARNANTVLEWSFRQMETGILAQLPADITPEERARLQQAFADVTAALKANRVDPTRLQQVQFKLIEIGRKGRDVTRQDILDLTQALEEVAGTAPGTTPPDSDSP